jgi:hypothetical protein
MLPAIREITPPKKMSRNIQFLESNQENANGVPICLQHSDTVVDFVFRRGDTMG